MFEYMFEFMHNIIQEPRECRVMTRQLETGDKQELADTRQDCYIDYQYDLIEALKEEFDI